MQRGGIRAIASQNLHVQRNALGIGRHGYDVYIGSDKAGVVTSGTQTPHLKRSIGMAYLPIEHNAPGSEFDVDIRGRRTRARVVPMPFYKRQK